MSTLKERFALLARANPAITQADLARATGAKPPSVNAWFSGNTKSMRASTAALAAKLYGADPHWLATGEGRPWANYSTTTLPSLGATSEEHHSKLRLGLLAVDEAIRQASTQSREELQHLFKLYLTDPTRYARLLEEIESVLRQGGPQK
ncbi:MULTISPECIES: helix-turn-helix domain-containing protein [unclassified Variovorax]|uniref:helix-turn-helix domain-containing protein n=1 Tax=unclassified Variovorax TaxID=663243 RepID=UPI003F481B3E